MTSLFFFLHELSFFSAPTTDLIDWEKRISVALMRSVGCRLLGGGVDFLFAKEGGNDRGVRENDETEGLGEEPDLGGVIVYR